MKLVWEIFQKESKLNTAIAEKALLRNDSNIPHVSFRKKLRKTNHKTIEYVRMAEIGMILTVQQSLILGRVTEERCKNQFFAKSYGRHRQGTWSSERLVAN